MTAEQSLRLAGQALDDHVRIHRRCYHGWGKFELVGEDRERYWDAWQNAIAHLLGAADGPGKRFREPLLRMQQQVEIARKEDRGEIAECEVPTDQWRSYGWSRASEATWPSTARGLPLHRIYEEMLAIYRVYDQRGENVSYSVKEAAAQLSISYSTMNKLLKAGEIEYYGGEQESSGYRAPRHVTLGALRRYIERKLEGT